MAAVQKRNPEGDTHMRDAVAFALKAEYEGTVEVEAEDGSGLVEVPKFQGGILYVGDGDINIADELEAGGGYIVVGTEDQRLRDLLEVYPALKRVEVPAGAKPLSMFARYPDEDLRLQGSLREIKGYASMSRAKLVKALEAHDAARRKGASEAAAAVAENPEIADGLDTLTKAKLLELAVKHDVHDGEGNQLTDRTTNDDIIARLRAAGVAAEGGDA